MPVNYLLTVLVMGVFGCLKFTLFKINITLQSSAKVSTEDLKVMRTHSDWLFSSDKITIG